MSNPSPKAFDTAVAMFFGPLASSAKLPIHRLVDGIYEVQGREFTMRIRRGIGHRKGILVTLVSTAARSGDMNDLSKEIGLGSVAEFRGETLAEPPIETDAAYMRYAHGLATAANRMLLPYVLGSAMDAEELFSFVAARVEKAASEFPDYSFLPRDSRKKWN